MVDEISSVSIRCAESIDFMLLAAMMAESDPWLKLGIKYSDLYNMVSDPFREVYLAQSDEAILGFVVLEMNGAFAGYIKSICVSPEYRGVGVGGLLMEYAEERVFREKPNVFLCVSSFNTSAQSFYQSLGYSVVGELTDYLVSGYSEVLMRKTIAPINEYKLNKPE